MKNQQPRRFAAGIVFVLALALAVAPAHAAVIIFKDGFYLIGKVRQPVDFVVDPGGASFRIPAGYYFVDDGVRRILFSPAQVQEVLKDDPKDKGGQMELKMPGPQFRGDDFKTSWQIEKIGDWNNKWQRPVVISAAGRKFTVRQCLTLMTPQKTRIDALRFNWMPHYFTIELGPTQVRSLLGKYYDGKKQMKKSDQQQNIIRFLYQTGWVDAAEKELDKFEKDFPALKGEVKSSREQLEKRQATIVGEGIVQAARVAQHQKIAEEMERFEKVAERVDEKLRSQVAEIKDRERSAAENLKQVRSYLKSLPAHVIGQPFFKEAVTALLAELSIDTLPRLEIFRDYARQYENETKQRKSHSQTAEQILSLAITGWLQGNAVAEPEVKTAKRLWQARKIVLEYQKTVDPGDRKQLADTLDKKLAIPVDVLDRLIRNLPPPEPPAGWMDGANAKPPAAKVDGAGAKLQAGKLNGAKAKVQAAKEPAGAKLQAAEPMVLEVADGLGAGATYVALLPPEYNPHRSYPVLMLLHGGADNPKDIIKRFSYHAALNGYILAAPALGKGIDVYQYTPREQALITGTLRDLRRKFQVDSDRVFLFGWREGATIAWDVGMSHPDMFAGLLPVNGDPRYYPTRYASNAQYLPIYAVEGDLNGSGPKWHKALFKDLIRGHYPALLFEYKGRASEWYPAEIIFMFDWMNRKTRANPIRQLGLAHTGGSKGEEFRTHRPCDNRFYWLSTDAINPRCLATFPDVKRNAAIYPATLQGNIQTGNELAVKKGGAVGNARIWYQIDVRAYGVQHVTVWLGPKMVDFSKRVMLRVNGTQMGRMHVVKPSIYTLLEDFYERGDRQRLYYARIEAKL